jgi:ABC-2 type transport system ATP-binding protein
VLATVVALLAMAPAALARDDVVTSFDGTPIATSFFPAEGLRPGQSVPTVLVGHGWGQRRDKDPNSSSDPALGSIGLGLLRRAGFNVLTWDARGFGESGGQAELDSPDTEARDVQTLIDYVGQQPEAQMDAVGDPRVGMVGASYGGGIQLVVAALDKRLDAIVPDTAWHSLITGLFKDGAVKYAWGNALFVTGMPSSFAGGPSVGQLGNLDPKASAWYQEALSNGYLSDEANRFFDARGPGDLVKKIRIPTLFTQGTADTLFTLRESIENYEILRTNGVPTKLVWFCGGHGACPTDPGLGGFVVQRAVLNWFERYLRRDHSIITGRRFEWIADDGTWNTGRDYPLAPAGSLNGRGYGDLQLAPGPGGAGQAAPTPQDGAMNVPIDPPPQNSTVLGEPRVDITYFGSADRPQTFVYAQIVDEARNIVVGNQVTPILVTLDGQPHTLSAKPLEAIAMNAPAGARYTLQLVPATTLYGQYGTGSITFVDVAVRLPVVDPAAKPPGYPPPNRLKLEPPSPTAARNGRVLWVRTTASPRLSRVVLVLRDVSRQVFGTSKPATFKGKRDVGIVLRRQVTRGSYVLTGTGLAPTGDTVRTTLRVTLG